MKDSGNDITRKHFDGIIKHFDTAVIVLTGTGYFPFGIAQSIL